MDIDVDMVIDVEVDVEVGFTWTMDMVGYDGE